MRYAQIRSLDVSNGEGIGISLFVQGCPFHCKGCFNESTWDFDGGHEWTDNIQKTFLNMAKNQYIERISILGGEPLVSKNAPKVLEFLNQTVLLFSGEKRVWLYTGFTWEEIFSHNDDAHNIRQEIVKLCDVIVDGRFEEDKKDLKLQFRGSSNQRIIDVKKSLEQERVVLWQKSS